MTDEATIAAARSAADAVVFKARADESFAQQLRDDPVGVLTAAGIDPEAAGQFGGEILTSEGSDVAGFKMCDWGTCWVTFCNYRTGSGIPLSDTCERMVGGVRG
jgi:hypothetical protein